MEFKTDLGEKIFNEKYKHDGCESWSLLAHVLVEEVCKNKLSKEDKSQLKQYIEDMKFIPGGRYLYYAGRPKRFYNNCYLLRCEEDSREDWANLSWKAESCLITGGGIGVDYSVYRPAGSVIGKTGGTASGPIPKMLMINEIGRRVMQGGARRSAIYASLNHKHSDINQFMESKNWHNQMVGTTGQSLWNIRNDDFDFPCPLDMTNISVNYDTEWLLNYYKTGDVGDVFRKNIEQAITTGEPGFSFNFFDKENETLRNACTEVTSEDDSDVCNLGSINLANIVSISDFKDVVELATKFLICGTLEAELPYQKIYEIREKNRRLGLGLMGVHEWLLQRGYKYEVTPELHQWLTVWQGVSDKVSRVFSNQLSISCPKANRAIAPTGTISILAGTTSGIEPIYAIAYKRRYLTESEGKSRRKYQYHIDHIAQTLIERYDLKPEAVESSVDLAADPERRIKLQADVQDYTDMAISSTINLPSNSMDVNMGHDRNKEKLDCSRLTSMVANYASRLRGLTFYPDGSRGGQPLVPVAYDDALKHKGTEFEEVNDVCDITGGGHCGI